MPGIRRAVEQWGTVISLDVRDEIAEEVVDACFAWFARVDELFSTWRPDTEIMRVGDGRLARRDASAEVIEVLEQCEGLRVESGGAFDIGFASRPEVPRREGFAPLDPSGYVKGWAVGRAATMLRGAGASRFALSAGGDLAATGHPDESPEGWRVGIQHPWQRDRVAAVLAITGAAVATSGRYERGEHVFDPRTGAAARGLASVTVVGPDLAIADAYATTVMVLGADAGPAWISTRVGYEALVITDDESVVSTPGFGRYRIS